MPFFNLLTTFFLSLVPVIGIVVTAMARRVHGRAAIIGMLGCFALLLNALAYLTQSVLLMSLSPGDIYGFVALMNVVSLVLNVTGVALLIWAVVARRPAAQPQQPAWQQQPYGRHPQPPQQGWQQPPHSGQG